MLIFNLLASPALSILSIPFVGAQFIDDLPQCVQSCIDQTPDTNCGTSEIGCICRASSRNFLPDIITCIHGNCDDNLDANVFLTPLQFACMIAGSPIPASAIRNAENSASSLATQITTTVTMDRSSADGGARATVSTVTITTTGSAGSTYYQIYQVTVGSTATVTGPTSTLTSIFTTSPTNGGFTRVIPVIIVATDSEGSTYTSTTTQSGVISTYTTTDSGGRTSRQRSTFTETAPAPETTADSGDISRPDSTGSSESTSSTTTSVAAAMTSSSRTSQAPNPDATNSSPFKDANGAGSLERGNWLGLSVLLAVLCVWV